MPAPKDPERYKEYIRKLSESHKGHHPTKETLIKMSGRTPWNKGLKGYMGSNITSFKKGYHQVDIMIVDHEGKPKLAIECDGCYWHSCPTHFPQNNLNKERDIIINKCVKELGIDLIRLWEHDIRVDNIPMVVFQ